MKNFLHTHFYLGRLASRTDHEFLDTSTEDLNVRPSMLRWFCGMHDMEETFICRML